MKFVRQLFRILNFVVSLSAVGTLIWFHGFRYRPDHLHDHLLYLHLSFAYFIVQFFFRAGVSGNLADYFKRNRLEQGIFAFLIVGMLVNWLLDFSLARWLLSFTGISESEHLFVLYLHIFLLLIVGIELGKVATKSTIWRLSPPLLFILSFVILIVIGSSLLMLPEMTADGKGMNFIDALFTSASGNCVTGLTVVDTATFFSIKGKVLLLFLIQLGGLNVIFFATFFISRYHAVITNKSDDLAVKELLGTNSLQGEQTGKLLWRVISTSLFIEFLGVLVLYNQWEPAAAFHGYTEKIFFSIFHSISAFNNAGFTLLTDGLTNQMVVVNHGLQITMAVLIILGGIGFTTLWDVADPRRLLRSGFRKLPLKLDTRVSIFTSLALIVAGAALFWMLENGRMTGTVDHTHSFVVSFFQSVSARTAGFHTTDISALSIPAAVLLVLLMFIGASSGSTGGGIKTSTFVVFVLSFFNRMRKGKPNAFHTSGPLFRKAITILAYSVVVVVIGSALLMFFENDEEFIDLLFEEVSAFGTVGLSRGVTGQLASPAKLILVMTMFIGRVGPLALAYALIPAAQVRQGSEREGIMIG